MDEGHYPRRCRLKALILSRDTNHDLARKVNYSKKALHDPGRQGKASGVSRTCLAHSGRGARMSVSSRGFFMFGEIAVLMEESSSLVFFAVSPFVHKAGSFPPSIRLCGMGDNK